MTENSAGRPSDDDDARRFNPREFEEFLKRYLADPSQFDMADLANQAGFPTDPQEVAKLLKHLQDAISLQGGMEEGVNWKLAVDQAKQVARKDNRAILDAQRVALTEAGNIAALWLDGATTVSQLVSEPKLLTRDLWVDDVMPLLRQLSEPVANRMSDALSEHLRSSAPAELDVVLQGAAGLMRSAGGAMFGMQLGQAVGRLSEQVISGSDLGLPIFTEQRAAYLPQNLAQFVLDLGVDQREALIYLCVREQAHARLFKHSRWLREAVVTQITAYAADISIDEGRLLDLAETQDLSNPDQLKQLLESGALISERTDEQTRALESIETLLALVEGWVQAVTEQATALLPKSAALSEAIRRRRSSGGPAEQVFSTLIGLDLRPRRLREATQMWRDLTTMLGNEKRDALWDHPDLLPTGGELGNAKLVVERLNAAGEGDDFDQALRDLLDGN